MKPSLIVAGLLSFSLISCESPNKSKTDEVDWSSQMRAMSESVQGLFPFVFASQFDVKKDKTKLVERLKVFKEQTNYLPSHIGEEIMGKDPIVRYSVNQLRSSVSQALDAVESGHIDYAQDVLKSAMGTCFSCHTAQQIGPTDLNAKSWMSNSLKLNETERADYFIATRQYDKAIGILESTLKTKKDFYESPYELSNAIRRYLAIEVRVKEDPKTAAATLQAFLDNKELPYYLKQETKQWMAALNTWMNEKSNKQSVEFARQLVSRADKKMSLNSGQGGLVEYLRASNILHKSLLSKASDKDKAEIYLLLGDVYEKLSDLGVWSLADAYYVACIETYPNTKNAEICYNHLERDIVMGFSGSAGIMVPVTERERLSRLRKKALRKN